MKRKRSEDRRVVYSTAPPFRERCEHCGESICRCAEQDALPKDAMRPRVQREKVGRGGKQVTVVYELNLSESALEELCGRLKKLCASGGTVKGGTVEIQGDHAERVVEALRKEGFRALRSGG